MGVLELRMMNARYVAEYATLMRLAHVPDTSSSPCRSWPWCGWSSGRRTRGLAWPRWGCAWWRLVVNFAAAVNLNYATLDGLRAGRVPRHAWSTCRSGRPAAGPGWARSEQRADARLCRWPPPRVACAPGPGAAAARAGDRRRAGVVRAGRRRHLDDDQQRGRGAAPVHDQPAVPRHRGGHGLRGQPRPGRRPGAWRRNCTRASSATNWRHRAAGLGLFSWQATGRRLWANAIARVHARRRRRHAAGSRPAPRTRAPGRPRCRARRRVRRALREHGDFEVGLSRRIRSGHSGAGSRRAARSSRP